MSRGALNLSRSDRRGTSVLAREGERPRDETRKAERFRKVPSYRGSTDNGRRFGAGAPDGAHPKGVAFRHRKSEQGMGPHERPTRRRIAGEVLPQRRPNGRKVGKVSGHRHDRTLEAFVEPVEVDQVEPPDGDPIQEHRPHSVEERRSFEHG